MKLVCGPANRAFATEAGALQVVLYGSAKKQGQGSIGARVLQEITKEKFYPSPRAWDFLSLALSVIAADLAGHRATSPDGWTRDFKVEIAVNEPDFWNDKKDLAEKALKFLTTDRWQLKFVDGGLAPPTPKKPTYSFEDSVVLLSGGLDSLIGATDLVSSGLRPFAVSQTVRGDAESQREFAHALAGGLSHLQVNHNAEIPDPENPPSQRARSLIFLAYGALVATSLQRYHAGKEVTLFVCENGFISINPPLTGGRLGSLSTRTTHPEFLNDIQQLFAAAGLRVRIQNPYQLKTKGEMLRECKNQSFLSAHAAESTSCGRFKQYGYTHCGRCVPCMVRRAAFLAWGKKDETEYVFQDLGKNDEHHAGFDDVRSVAMAVHEMESVGIQEWIGMAVSTTSLGDISQLEQVVKRGLVELKSLLKAYGVK